MYTRAISLQEGDRIPEGKVVSVVWRFSNESKLARVWVKVRCKGGRVRSILFRPSAQILKIIPLL